MSNATSTLARFVADARLSDLPETTLVQCRRTVLNIIGCMVGGAGHESVEAAVATLAPFSGAPVATALGRGQSFDPLLAALVNGMSASVFSFDDTHAEAVVHPGGPVAAALLALAESRRASGAEWLLAFALGAEVVCRVSKAVSVAPAKAGPSWVQTGICAGIGAAAAAGKLLQLDAPRIAAAMGIAACQSGGVRALTRSMCYSLMCGQAAQSGLRAALLAAQGFTSAAEGLTAAGGFCDAYASKANADAVCDRLGSHFEIEANTFKPYPCGVVIHPAIDACLALRDTPDLPDVGEIERIRIRVSPSVIALCDIAQPRDPFEGQVSVQHWVAAVLVDGKAGTAQSRQSRIDDPVIKAVRGKVVIEPDASIERDAAEVIVDTRAGGSLGRRVEHCRGSAKRPMTDAELEGKLRDQCAAVMDTGTIDRIIRSCWSLDSLSDAGELARLAAGSHPVVTGSKGGGDGKR